MSMAVEELTTEAMQLPVSSLAELAEKLVASLDFASDNAKRAASPTEAIRRRDDVHSGRVQTIPGERVLGEIRQTLGQSGVSFTQRPASNSASQQLFIKPVAPDSAWSSPV